MSTMRPEMQLAATVNGTTRADLIESRTLLVTYIRDVVGLRGTNVGCDTSSCGACTVHLDGAAVKSCTLLAVQAEGAEITTIEGLAAGELHPVQASFREHHALQCGFCTPGMVMAAAALLADGEALTEESVRENLEGNLCRCTGYQNIIDAVLACGSTRQAQP